MIDRSDAQVYFKQDIPLSNMDEYIDKKAQDGIRMSYMNIIYAGIVRIINERPKLKTIVMNGTTYQRDTIYVSLSIKKSLTDDGQETVVKIPFKGTETILEIKDSIESPLNNAITSSLTVLSASNNSTCSIDHLAFASSF